MKAAGAAEAEWGLSVGAVGQTCTCCDGKLGPAFWLLPPPAVLGLALARRDMIEPLRAAP